MTSSQTSAPITRQALGDEAALLAHLIEQYVNDRGDAESDDTEPRLIYFVDSHELNAFLHGNEAATMKGFTLQAEAALAPSNPQVLLKARLKSDEIQHWLLFDRKAQVILLPAHAEEIDNEIAFQNRETLKKHNELIGRAQVEWANLKSGQLSVGMLATHVDAAVSNKDNAKRDLIRLINLAAPALAALLRMAPNTFEDRVRELGSNSNLVTLGHARWEEFGFDAATCEKIRSLEADVADTERWRRRLSDLRRNSLAANQADAEAFAFLASFNELMKREARKTRGVLVTRAQTLVGMLRPGTEHGGSDRSGSALIRYSRLMAISPNDSPGHLDGQHERFRAVSDALGKLRIALTTYQKQLETSASATMTPIQADVDVLLTAWNELEAARFTMELREQPRAGGSDEHRMVNVERMLDWLKSDRDVEALVIELFNEGVWTFNRETFARYFEEPQPTRAKTLPAMRGDCIRLLPMVDKWLGPIEFSRACFSGDPAVLQNSRGTLVDLDGLASRDDNAAENFLVWALLYACRNDWRRGTIYAESAIESAKLTQHKSAGAEAQFLLAQILRHRRPHAPLRLAEDQSRLKRAHERLIRCGISPKDSRMALESAAQVLDGLLLHVHESESAREAAYFEGFGHIEAAQGSAAKDIGTRLRIADLASGYLLLARNREQFPKISVRDLYLRMTEHHDDLLECLAMLRGEGFVNESIPASTRALEIIGHKLRRDLAKDAGEEFASAGLAPVAGDVEALRTALDGATDRLGLFLSSELGRIIVDAEASKDSNLVYVPIWEGAWTGSIFEAGLNDDNAAAAAAEANTIVHDVGSNQKVFGVDRSQLQRLAKACALFDEAIELSGGASGEARFYLHMERCYAELLRSRMLSGQSRDDCLHKLAASYEELDRKHPNSTAIHFRYSIVLSELDRDPEALLAMQAAKACIGHDRLVGEDHWIESTIARRLSVPHAKAADKLDEDLRKNPADDKLRARYLQELRQAFAILYEGFDVNVHSKTRLGLIEDRRRLNNIIYFAARFLAAGGEASALAEDFDREQLKRFTQKLQSGGTDDPVEWGIVHTLGEAWSALGHVEEASALADKLVTLIAHSGEEIASARVQKALSDMLTWRRAGAKAAAVA